MTEELLKRANEIASDLRRINGIRERYLQIIKGLFDDPGIPASSSISEGTQARILAFTQSEITKELDGRERELLSQFNVL
jgi:hypothetical protein